MKHFSLLLLAAFITLFSGCGSSNSSLSFGKNVKKEYYTGGMLRSEFIMDDSTEMNGVRKEYGYDGKLTSIAPIQNGVKHGVEKWFDPEERVILTVPYVNGRKDGLQTAYYPNGQPMITITFVKGMKHGPATAYKKDGSVYQVVNYKNDQRVY